MRKTSVCIFTLLVLVALTAMPAVSQSSSAPAATTPASTTTTTTATSGTTTKTTKHHPKKCKAAKGALADKAADCATFKVGDRSFSANEKTTYWICKKKAACADFANGDKVSVTCASKDGVDWAKTVKKCEKMGKTSTTTTTVTPPPHQ